MRSAVLMRKKLGHICNQENEILLANETTRQTYLYFTHWKGDDKIL
jgi:hypothetical protein